MILIAKCAGSLLLFNYFDKYPYESHITKKKSLRGLKGFLGKIMNKIRYKA